jgi:hypothetical protein
MSQGFSPLVKAAAAATAGLVMSACGSSATAPSASATGLRDDAALFRLITSTDPFTSYTAFPNAEELATGRLNGSEAHPSIVRVSLNATAAGALQNGRLAPGGSFPDGSIVFKEIRPVVGAAPTLYAVMVKDRGSDLSGNGWLWAEFTPAGSTVFSISRRGNGCTTCHQRDQGPVNDLVRTFERQR